MKVLRLTTVEQIIEYWPFITSAFRQAEARTNDKINDEEMFKAFTFLAIRPSVAWIGVALDSFGNRLSFGVAKDTSPLFGTVRKFTVEFLHFEKNRIDSVLRLMRQFEGWAKESGITSYDYLTTRFSGNAQDCLERFKMRKSHVRFTKVL